VELATPATDWPVGRTSHQSSPKLRLGKLGFAVKSEPYLGVKPRLSAAVPTRWHYLRPSALKLLCNWIPDHDPRLRFQLRRDKPSRPE